MNKLGISLWNWKEELSDACLGLPARAARLGFTAVELPMTQPDISRALEEEIKENGLAVSLCAALGPGRDLSSFDGQVRCDTMDYLTACLKAGERLGASVLCGPLYAGGGKRHRLSDEDKKREWELAVAGLRELARRADECGMELAVEPVNRYRTSVANTAGQVLAMLDETGCENAGLLFDTYHACLEEKDLTGALREALRAGRVNHFHACASNRGAPGEGIVPWTAVLDLLTEYRYTGHITMETFVAGSLDASWIQVHEEPDVLAKAGVTYLKQYFDRRQKR